MHNVRIGLVLVLATLASVASAPSSDDATGLVSVSFSLENEYAESIFTASYEVPEATNLGDEFEGEATGELANELRLDAYETHEVTDAFSAPEGTEVVVTFIGRSLGDDYEFEPITMEIEGPGESLCRLVYTYDLANAAFSVGHGCN